MKLVQKLFHGATGKGNDQVRFELGALALRPDIKVIAPGEWDLNSRESLLEYAKKMELKLLKNTLMKMEIQKKSPYSMDANLYISLMRDYI